MKGVKKVELAKISAMIQYLSEVDILKMDLQIISAQFRLQ